MKILRISLLILLFGGSIFLSSQIYQQEKLKQSLTADLSELSDISYGILNVDEWSSLLSSAIGKQMEDFKISEGDETQIKRQISGFLSQAIDGFEKRYNKENQGSGLTSLFRRSIASFAGIFDQVKKDIPVFTDQIYTFLTEDGTAKLLEEYISTQLKTYTKGTFAETDYTVYNMLITKYDSENAASAKMIIKDKIDTVKSEVTLYYWLLGVGFVLMLSLLIFRMQVSKWEVLIHIFYSLSLLVLGIFIPMIAINASIKEMSFQFLGQSISFSDQVLFYRSKSIMEVVEILFQQQRWDIILVGILIVLFSVIFPVSKLVASLVYCFQEKLQTNKFVKLLVFKTGKWSMADVFVIALFMAYLGFDGILTDQLKQLQYQSDSVKVISTNQSELLFGFYAFTAFVLFSLFISQKIKKLK